MSLDARQRAMLAEMGIRLFEPPASDAAVPAPARASPPARATVREQAPARPVEAAPAPPPAFEAAAAPAAGQVPASLDVEAMDWDTLGQAVAGCQACGLCQGRRQAVFGAGDRQAAWMVVGDAPGEEEDLRGEPFAGQAGQLLDNMLRAVGVDRQQGAYLTTAIKCRPPGNRPPAPQELASCAAHLRRQVALLQPRVILALGRLAVQSLLGSTEPLGRLRGGVHEFQGVPVVVSYPPAYLLRNPGDKGKAWEDLCLGLTKLEP
nr:uracil-DNA glycosylase [Ramlibacter rhizophilus]